MGAVRPSLCYRRYFGSEPQAGRAAFTAELGLYGVIPSARDISDSYSDEEQNDADEGAAYTRKSIGALGGWLGPGFSYLVTDALLLGARYHLILNRGQIYTEDALSISTALYAEAALVFEVRL